MIKQRISMALMFLSSAICASPFYINTGAGFDYSRSKSGFVENSSSVLFSPTAPGTSLFSLPDVNWNNQFGSGFILNGLLGYHVNDQFALESEVVYHHLKRTSSGSYGWLEQDASNGSVYARQANNPIDSVSKSAELLQWMANVVYRFQDHKAYIPYVGAGAGVAWIHSGRAVTNNILNVDDPNTPLVETAPARQISPKLSGTAFSWQFKAGVLKQINDGMSLGLQYQLTGTSHFLASRSVIISNPGAAGESYFYIPAHQVSGVLTQAIGIQCWFNL